MKFWGPVFKQNMPQIKSILVLFVFIFFLFILIIKNTPNILTRVIHGLLYRKIQSGVISISEIPKCQQIRKWKERTCYGEVKGLLK